MKMLSRRGLGLSVSRNIISAFLHVCVRQSTSMEPCLTICQTNHAKIGSFTTSVAREHWYVDIPSLNLVLSGNSLVAATRLVLIL